MKAGRDLDALVAEKVMELDLSQPCKDSELHEYYDGWACIACGLRGDWGDSDIYFGHTIQPRHHSTSIADAWMVVEKMKRVGFRWAINSELNTWDVYLEDKRMGSGEGRGDVELAICLAALKAVGYEG